MFFFGEQLGYFSFFISRFLTLFPLSRTGLSASFAAVQMTMVLFTRALAFANPFVVSTWVARRDTKRMVKFHQRGRKKTPTT